MIYSIRFVYNDGKDLVVNVLEAKATEFFGALNTKTAFFDQENNHGFWTDLDKVRYVEFRKIPVEGEANAEQQPEKLPEGVPQDSAEPA